MQENTLNATNPEAYSFRIFLSYYISDNFCAIMKAYYQICLISGILPQTAIDL